MCKVNILKKFINKSYDYRYMDEGEDKSKNSDNVQDNQDVFWKKFGWEEYFLATVVFILAIVYIAYISGYTQVPSPIFGGDLYRDRGFINNIVSGNPIWSDGYYANEIQYYPYLIFTIEAGIVKITWLSVDSVFLFFPLITLVASAIVWYILGRLLFKGRKWGLLTSLTFLFLIFSTNPKGANIALFVFIPAFILFWLKYDQQGKVKYAVWSGVFLGLVSLTYGGIFLSSIAMFGLVVLYRYIRDSVSEKSAKKWIPNLWAYIKKYYIIFAIAIVIAMIFFMPLIIKYHMHQVNLVTVWGDTKIDLLGPAWIFQVITGLLFYDWSIPWIIIGIIAIVGIIGMIIVKKNTEAELIVLLFLSNIIVVEHFLITKPLFGISFLPEKLIYIQYLMPLLFVFGVLVLYKFIKNKNIKTAVYFIAIALLLIAFNARFSSMKNDTWEKAGHSDNSYTQSLYTLGNYLQENMQKNDAVLSNDESGFMLAVVSGRKVMLTRRTHASYYVDIDQRKADASVAMYGNNTELTKEILKKYNVKYFYVDQQLLQYPMRTRPDLKDYLLKNNIEFIEAYDRYDIALPPERANEMNLLIIPPQNISKSFTDLWESAYTVSVQGQVVGQLYKLKSTSS